MEVLRTPDDCFQVLPGYPFEPNYLDVADPDGGSLRMHYADEGPRDAPPVLMLHGNPDWSYAFRSLISAVERAGLRAVAPDMLGFGRSDKPVDRRAHSIDQHIDWLCRFVVDLDLDLANITLVCQDWGGTMGLGVVAREMDRFARIVTTNTILHTAEASLAGRLPSEFTVHATSATEVSIGTAMLAWLARSQRMPGIRASDSVLGMHANVAPEIAVGYDAPFPDEDHVTAWRQFAMLIPLRPDDEGALRNRETWGALAGFERPFVTRQKGPTSPGGGLVVEMSSIGGAENAA